MRNYVSKVVKEGEMDEILRAVFGGKSNPLLIQRFIEGMTEMDYFYREIYHPNYTIVVRVSFRPKY